MHCAFRGNELTESGQHSLTICLDKEPVFGEEPSEKQCQWIYRVKRVTSNFSPTGKVICITKLLCVSVCLKMSCRVISSFKLLLTTAFISTLQIELVINTYYL